MSSWSPTSSRFTQLTPLRPWRDGVEQLDTSQSATGRSFAPSLFLVLESRTTTADFGTCENDFNIDHACSIESAMELFVALAAVIAVAIFAVILFRRSRERRAVCA